VLGEDGLVRLAVVIVTALLLTGCTGSDSSSRADPTPLLHSPTPTTNETVSPPPKPPKPPPSNACYRLGYDEALAPTHDKKPVPCSGVHTAVTYFVGSFDKSLAVDGKQVQGLESTVCPRRFAT
jgi:hypothetical protein